MNGLEESVPMAKYHQMRGNCLGSTDAIRTLKHSKLSFLNQLSLKALSIIQDSGIFSWFTVSDIGSEMNFPKLLISKHTNGNNMAAIVTPSKQREDQ